MDIFVARQPIFNTQSQVVAYELLFRNSELNQAEYVDDNQATKEVLVNVFRKWALIPLLKVKKPSLILARPCFSSKFRSFCRQMYWPLKFWKQSPHARGYRRLRAIKKRRLLAGA